MAAFSKLTSAPDKRSWATLEQIRWLVSWLQEYILAQQTHTLHKFWPRLFAAWFKEYPLPQPTDNDVEIPEAELEDTSDVPAESADENAVKAEQKRHKARDRKRKLRAKKVCLLLALLPVNMLNIFRMPTTRRLRVSRG